MKIMFEFMNIYDNQQIREFPGSQLPGIPAWNPAGTEMNPDKSSEESPKHIEPFSAKN